MKTIIKGEELTEKINEAITLLSNAVKTTLGPNGNNVIINEANITPYITNDGVTIAEHVSSDDIIIDTILTLLKEAALKTDSDIGDGTTTTIVLLESIYKNSVKIMNKSDALKLKDELQVSLANVLKKLRELSHIPSDAELLNIASISANDQKIGSLITNFYLNLDKSSNIKLMENTKGATDYVEKMPGYFLENTLASPYFFKEKEISIKNPTLILFNSEIASITELENIIYENANKDIVIMANNFTDDVINDILALNYEQDKKIILLNNPEYGIRKMDTIDDLKEISSYKKVANYFQGNITEFKISDNKEIFIYKESTKIDNYLNKLTAQLLKENDEYEQNYLKDRINKLKVTYGLIYVGGATKLERREKIMRFTDALCALNATKYGILPGSGLPLYQIGDNFKKTTDADKIIAKSLKAPLLQILKNSNVAIEEVINKIKDNDYQILFNAKNKTFESIKNTNVLDNFKVLECALTNAVSIASLMLSTSHLIIDTNNQNLNLTNIATDF